MLKLRSNCHLWWLVCVVVLSAAVSRAQDRVQLGELRAHFLNQRVVINGSFSDNAVPFLAGWQFVKEKKGIFVADYGRDVPTSFVGREGVIVAVQAPQGVLEPPVSQADTSFVNYGEAIIRLDSGQTVETALYGTFLHSSPGSHPSDAFTLTSVLDEHRRQGERLASELSGKSLFLSRLTRIYDMGLTTANIETVKAGVGYSQAEIRDFPLLTPLPVVESHYSPERDFTTVELQLPNGTKALFVLGCIEDPPVPKKACASTSMPNFLSQREIEAVRRGSVFIGMSEAALYMSMGFPRETNGQSVGDSQLVYLSAYVYVDQNGKVVQIQDRN